MSQFLSDRGRRTPSANNPIVGVRQLPLLPAQYVAAYSESSPTEKHWHFLHRERAFRYSAESETGSLPPGWKAYIHPQGWVYYYQADARLVTDFRMNFILGQQEFQKALDEVEGYPVQKLPAHCEMWIDYRLEEGYQVAEKHFVDHEKRRLTPRVPIHRGDLQPDGSWQDEQLDSATQLKYEQAYWEYIIAHPCHVSLSVNAEEDALAILAWYNQDRLLNPEDSLAPYSRDLSKSLLELLVTMIQEEKTFNSQRNGYIKTHLVASILERSAGERLRRHYGRHDARLYLSNMLRRRSELLESTENPGLNFALDLCMTVPCFGVPYAYLRQINEFFVTTVGRTDTITERWKAFVDENVADWTNTNLVATVLISGSVALLAVPGIDTSTRLIGIISTLASLSSLISGLLNVWQHQHKSRTSLELTVIFDFFSQAERGVKTDKLLATLLSLPLVLLIWATLLFAAAMVTFAWRGLDTTFVDHGTGAEFFGPPTAWVSTGLFILLITTVLVSFLFFWRAWRPSNVEKRGWLSLLLKIFRSDYG